MVVRQLSVLYLREVGKGFLISLRASNRYSQGYLSALESAIALASMFAEEQGWPPVRDITTAHIEEYLTYLQLRPRWFGDQGKKKPRPVSQSYIETQYRRLNRFFVWLAERGHIEDNPLRLIAHPHVDERTVPIVAEYEMEGLLALLDPAEAKTSPHRFRLVRNRAVVYLLCDSPGRRNELATIQVDGVDLDSGAIRVMGKGRRERWMPIGDTASTVLWEYMQERADLKPDTHELWVSTRGFEMTPTWLYRMLRRLGDRAGIPNLHTHRFRHSYAVNALRGGMPERVLQIVGGWKKIPETYFKTLGEEDAIRFHREISPGDRLGQGQGSGPAKPRPGRQRSQGKPRGKL